MFVRSWRLRDFLMNRYRLAHVTAFHYDGVVSDQCFSDGVTAVACDCDTGACE